MLSRRAVFGGVLTAGILSVSGCASIIRPREHGGQIVVENRSGDHREVRVIVSKISDDSDDAEMHPDDPDPPSEPVWQREYTFNVPDGESYDNTDLITDPGAYHVEAQADHGYSVRDEFGLYPAGSEGTLPGGGYISVRVRELDHNPPISLSRVTSD